MYLSVPKTHAQPGRECSKVSATASRSERFSRMPQQMIQQAAHLGFGYGQTNASRHSQTNARMEQMRPHKQMHTLAALVNVIVDMSLESLNTQGKHFLLLYPKMNRS